MQTAGGQLQGRCGPDTRQRIVGAVVAHRRPTTAVRVLKLPTTPGHASNDGVSAALHRCSGYGQVLEVTAHADPCLAQCPCRQAAAAAAIRLLPPRAAVDCGSTFLVYPGRAPRLHSAGAGPPHPQQQQQQQWQKLLY